MKRDDLFVFSAAAIFLAACSQPEAPQEDLPPLVDGEEAATSPLTVNPVPDEDDPTPMAPETPPVLPEGESSEVMEMAPNPVP